MIECSKRSGERTILIGPFTFTIL